VSVLSYLITIKWWWWWWWWFWKAYLAAPTLFTTFILLQHLQGRIQGVSRVSGHLPFWLRCLFWKKKHIFNLHVFSWTGCFSIREDEAGIKSQVPNLRILVRTGFEWCRAYHHIIYHITYLFAQKYTKNSKCQHAVAELDGALTVAYKIKMEYNMNK